MQDRGPSPVLAGLLLCISLVFLPVDSMSPEDVSTEHAVLERTDVPAFIDMGEGNASPTPTAQQEHQKALAAVELLLHEPVMDPKSVKEYKEGEKTLKTAEGDVKEDLMDVVQMGALLGRVNELQVKKASGENIDVDSWAHTAHEGLDVIEVEEEDAAAAAAEPCFDSHTGLCGGIQSQGHCGIKEYAKQCRLSCHICAMPAAFRMGLDASEKTTKQAEEKSAKVAKAAVHKEFVAKHTEAQKKVNIEYQKVSLAHAKEKNQAERVSELKGKMEKLTSTSEKSEKLAQGGKEKANAKAKSAKERIEKDKKAAPKLIKPDESAIKGAKGAVKEVAEKKKKSEGDLKKADGAIKKDEKAVKDLEKKKAGSEATKEKLQDQEAEIKEKKEESKNQEKLAERMAGKEGDQVKTLIEMAHTHSLKAKEHIEKRTVILKKKLGQTFKEEEALDVSREKAEITNKDEQNRLMQMTAPGVEKNIKMENIQTDRDVTSLRRKFHKEARKYTDLGLKWTIPVEMEHAFAKAKLAQTLAEKDLVKLDKKANGPAMFNLNMQEKKAKGIMVADTEKFRAMKKIADEEKKSIKGLQDEEKKQQEAIKKELGVSVESAKKVLDDAKKKAKTDDEDAKKSQEAMSKEEDKAAKDTVSDDQIEDAEKMSDKARQEARKEKNKLRKTERVMQKAKGKVQKVEKEVNAMKQKAVQDLAVAKDAQGKEIAAQEEKMQMEKVKVKTYDAKLKSIKGSRKKLKEINKQYQEAIGKHDKMKQDVAKMEAVLEDRRDDMKETLKGEMSKEKEVEAEAEAKAEEADQEEGDDKKEVTKEEEKAEEKADEAAKKAGLSGKAETAAKEVAKEAVEKADAEAKNDTKAKVKEAEQTAAKAAEAKGGTEVDKAVQEAEKKAAKEAKKEGEDPKEAKEAAKQEVLEAVDAAKAEAEKEGAAEERAAAMAAASAETSSAVDSASASVMSATQEAIADAMPINLQPQQHDSTPIGCEDKRARADANAMICKIVKAKGHCDLQNYKNFCQKSCNPCEAPPEKETTVSADGDDTEAAETSSPGMSEAVSLVREKMEDDQSDEDDDESADSGNSGELADSKEDSITQLEDQLGKSISAANKAIKNSPGTEMLASLSD